jgi:hypothetical protein
VERRYGLHVGIDERAYPAHGASLPVAA